MPLCSRRVLDAVEGVLDLAAGVVVAVSGRAREGLGGLLRAEERGPRLEWGLRLREHVHVRGDELLAGLRGLIREPSPLELLLRGRLHHRPLRLVSRHLLHHFLPRLLRHQRLLRVVVYVSVPRLLPLHERPDEPALPTAPHRSPSLLFLLRRVVRLS